MLTAAFKLKPYHFVILSFLAALLILAMIKMYSHWSQTVFAETTEEMTEEGVCEYLKSFGWEPDLETVEKQTIRIPAEFNEVYNDYNELQHSQGFDLSGFKGESVTKYNIKILNHPEASENVYAHILVFENRIIGADICSTDLNGFIQGLT